MKEVTIRGHLSSHMASGVSVRSDSRYDRPTEIPTPSEVAALLRAADELANSDNKHIANTWQRYRPMLYLAVDSGMRPQEYVALPKKNIRDGGVLVDQALERGEARISVTKTRAGRRFIDLSPETYDMIKHYADRKALPSKYDLVFPTKLGRWMSPDHWRKRGFYAACIQAKLVRSVGREGKEIQKPKFKPYDSQHFYASMLIDSRLSLKRLQSIMGHEDISTTLNVYGHLIEERDRKDDAELTMLKQLDGKPCGKSVAEAL